MTRPTGRPRGRPKKLFYETMMARIPSDLAEQVRGYAGRKRQTISDVLRDGLLVLLQDEETYRPFPPTRLLEADNVSDAKGDAGTHVSTDDNMSDIKGDAGTHVNTQAIMSDTKENVPGSDLSPVLSLPAYILLDRNAPSRAPDVLTQTPGNMPLAQPATGFDPARYKLGKLCPHGHAWQDTGQSLLRIVNHKCKECDRLQARARRQRARQAIKV